jgi:hypothetical protein
MKENIEKDVNRVVILVELPWGRDKDPRVPLGHASLLSKIRLDDGIKVHSVVHPVNNSDFDVIKVFNEIIRLVNANKETQIDLAFGVYVWSEDIIQRLLLMMSMADFQGRIILGGPQISYSGIGLEKHYPNADIFIRGYGEFALSTLIKSKSRIQIPGVHYAGEKDLLQQSSVEWQSDTFTYNDWFKMAQMSEALKQTEGNHPSKIQELKKIAKRLNVNHSRYRPNIEINKSHIKVA